MKRLQIKYCYSEKETNEFLMTLACDNWEEGKIAYPRLANVQYMANVRGDGVQTEEANDNGVVANMTINNDIIAIVHYFIEVE